MSDHSIAMKLSEVLYRAADRIEWFGHLKGAAIGPEGDYRTAPTCAVGAISVTTLPDVELGRRAADALSAHLGRGIVDWNDEDERTADEVVEALRAAAVIEAAKETAVVPAEVTS